MSFLLNRASIIACPHGGRVLVTPLPGVNYLVDGTPVCVKENAYSIYGCPMAQNKCLTVKWEDAPSAFLLNGRYQVLTNTSVGLCFDHKNLMTGKAVTHLCQTKISLEDWEGYFKSK